MAAFTTIQIIGPSMEPVLKNNDVWLAKLGTQAKPGHVIAFWEPGRPGLLVVKRISHATPEGWWVVADNQRGALDSAHYGAVPIDAVVARLWCRLRPMFRRS